MRTTARTLLLTAASILAGTPLRAQGVAPTAAVADPLNVVAAGDVRFTLLTPQLIRLEWSADARFEDRPSLVFLDRRSPPVTYTKREENGWLLVATERLELRYRSASGRFTPENLSITLANADSTVTWRPGTSDTANLRGTTRTLDGARGEVPLEQGLLSRAGWAVVDDSERPLFDDSPWPWVVQRPSAARQDWYFFGHGNDYRRALADFTRVAGRIPLPPRFAFGAWWSRYWAYTDAQFERLVRDFDRYDVPLDVLVIDMDWHNTFELRWEGQPRDQAGQPLGWTGYTWNRAYFPDPDAFLDWTAARGLRTPLNLHPASGIQPHEAQYPAMARALGVDPATQQYLPFRIEDKQFAEAYFEHVIHPLERQGVDFWWLDWQQWGSTSVPGLNPTWWLNYVFFTDMERQGKSRPLIFHRWGGLGNHRYQIGFSGDAFSTWEALSFQPYFTATAANVGFGYWSHDIGGHLQGDVPPELYTRWIQFGIFSPILRTHTTRNANAERRIWAYPAEFADVMRDAFQLRYALIPYIYTAARRAYDTGVAVVHPLYYQWPDADEAYAFPNQYRFGDDLVVSPVVAPMDSTSLLARQRLWLPPGEWVEWSSGSVLRGPAVVERSFALDELPVYARAGAIIPLQPPMERSGERPVDPLILDVFPGDSGSARIYEDAGDSLAYRDGGYTFTPVLQRRSGRSIALTIAPVEGYFPTMLRERAYQVRLRGTWPPARVTWNGEEIGYRADGAAPGWRYDGDELTTIVSLPRAGVATRKELVVEQRADGEAELLDGVPGRLKRLERAMTVLEALWPQDWPSDAYVSVAQTGRRITLQPDSVLPELLRFHEQLPEVLRALPQLKGDTAVIRRALRHLDQPR